MTIGIVQPRPPYVVFEIRAEEDRTATIESGSPKFRDVDYAIITPAGSKDRVEREVKAWFEHLDREVTSQRFPIEWLGNFKAQYAAWKDGREAPLDGTPIIRWPAVTPAQVKDLLGLKIKTVEDLAAANEETLKRLGMGARALKQQAVEWLASANDIGKVSSRITALEIRNEEQVRHIKDLEDRNAALAAQINNLQPAPAPQ